jgi:hypothetical protein
MAKTTKPEIDKQIKDPKLRGAVWGMDGNGGRLN